MNSEHRTPNPVLPEPAAVLTVDLEEWYHVCGVPDHLPRSGWHALERRITAATGILLDILARHAVRATFFVLGSVAEEHPDLIHAFAAQGHEIACHGHDHRRVYTMTPDQFQEDIHRAVAAIGAAAGMRPIGFRAPEWSINEASLWALDILAATGFAYDASMAPLPIIGDLTYSHTPYRRNTAGGPIWEIPPLVGKFPWGNLPLGGGWGLRVFPMAWIRRNVKRLHDQNAPAVFFVHPREFDADCPTPPLPLAKQFVLRARVTRTGKRLGKLLPQYRFITLSDWVADADIKRAAVEG